MIKLGEYHQIMRKKFNRWVKIYDLLEILPEAKKLRKAVVDQVDEDGNVIDICCGTGTVAIRVAKSRPLSTIFGLDLSVDMLKIAKKKSLGLKTINFIEGIAENIPFPDRYFDFIIISFALHEMPKEMRTLVLNECLRVLKNRGKMIILDIRKIRKWMKYPFLFYLKLFEPSYVFEFIEENLKNTLMETGFSSVNQVTISASHLTVAEKSIKE